MDKDKEMDMTWTYCTRTYCIPTDKGTVHHTVHGHRYCTRTYCTCIRTLLYTDKLYIHIRTYCTRTYFTRTTVHGHTLQGHAVQGHTVQGHTVQGHTVQRHTVQGHAVHELFFFELYGFTTTYILTNYGKISRKIESSLFETRLNLILN